MVADRFPPAEPTRDAADDAPPDPAISPHDRHVGTIAVWLSEHSSADLAVDVVTGPNRVPVARGHYIEIEAHPTAKGVHRLVFDNSLAGADPPLGQPWVTVGGELVDVAAGDVSLIIDKGAQRVEVKVIGATAPAWSTASAPVAVSTPPPATTAPPQPSPVASASILETYAPSSSAITAAAPLHQNAALLGSKLFGETTLEVTGSELRVTAKRMSRLTAFLVMTGIVVLVFAIVPLMFYALFLFNQNVLDSPADPDLLRDTLRGAATIGAVGAGLFVLGFLSSRGRKPETFTVPTQAASGRKSGRVYMLKLPVGTRGKRRRLILKPSGRADAARLQHLLAQLRG